MTQLEDLIERARTPSSWPDGVVPLTALELLDVIERQRLDMVDRRVLGDMRNEIGDQWGWDKSVADKQSTLTGLLDRLVPEPDETVLLQADLDHARDVVIFDIRTHIAALDTDTAASPPYRYRALMLLNSLFNRSTAAQIAAENWVRPHTAKQLHILAR